ncbi:MAG: acyl carrier protein [Bacteroidales bacterium]|jgi:acyl carrier protein|nr:acyl carrier protein [Bacteroidales bacterium]MBQ5486074.1 acyl carrier protein [Bacteroidales bacterium]
MTIEKINEIVKNFLVEDLEIEEEKIEGSARLKEDLGIDSLEVVDVVVLVEDQFGYKMKPEDFRTLITLDDFCQFIQQHIA